MTHLIETGNVENTFTLLPDGRLYLTAVPSQDEYRLMVRAIDGGTIPKFATATIVVHVNETGCAPFDTNIMYVSVLTFIPIYFYFIF